MDNKSRWIWYYGDFEIYHSLKMQTRREEYNYMFPPFWKLDDCYHNVKFKKDVILEKDEVITVYSNGVGMVEIDGKRNEFKKELSIEEGKHTIIIYVANITGLPSAYVVGDSIVSDSTWSASYYGKEWTKVGCTDDYVDVNMDPQVFPFHYTKIVPIAKKEINHGMLYDYGRETFAKLNFTKLNVDIEIFYGESEEEALDMKDSYLRDKLFMNESRRELPSRAFRYLYIPRIPSENYSFEAYYEYLPLEIKGSFKCSDDRINKIWETSVYTFHLNSREFFLDGIKRDRWVWSGDAYQSYLINRYLFFDEDISKRTIIALRGKDPIESHINTIVDYSFYWIISIYDHYEMTKDKEFIKLIYPKMVSLMDFCMTRCDSNGFISKVDDDWIFIDWATMDKTGAVCAIQMLYIRALEIMSKCCEILDIKNEKYNSLTQDLKRKINKFYWNEEKGAYIDSFESGKNHVTRHANIFAILFGYVDDKQKNSIINNVLLNEDIPPIKTPYFKFYELESMCFIGKMDEVLDLMNQYWGGMLDLGATSFWEEYSPLITGVGQYKMYEDKFGKSLCHAWGASPIYLIGKYYLGVKPTSAGYETFEVKPYLGKLDWMEGDVPIKGGKVNIKLKDGILEVVSDKDGGTLIYNQKRYNLVKDVPLCVSVS